MKKTQTLLVLFSGLAFGCSSSSSNPPPPVQDFATPNDLAVTVDLSAAGDDMSTPAQDLLGADLLGVDLATMPTPTPTPTATTAHDIDVNAGGQFSSGTQVTVDNLYVLGVSVTPFFTKSTSTCNYPIFTQDNGCSTPPCGIEVYYTVAPATSPCPATAVTAVPAAQGNLVSVAGTVNVGAASGFPNYNVVNHGLVTSAGGITVVDPAASPAPSTFPVTDATLFSALRTPGGVGTGWATYEGTLINFTPADNIDITKVYVTATSNGALGATSGPTTLYFGHHIYTGPSPSPAPAVGVMYKSISGWVSTDSEGAIEPRTAADFVGP